VPDADAEAAQPSSSSGPGSKKKKKDRTYCKRPTSTPCIRSWALLSALPLNGSHSYPPPFTISQLWPVSTHLFGPAPVTFIQEHRKYSGVELSISLVE
jgi:hypothetical protein